MERIKHKKYKYRTVSLFSGIGGFDLGFSNAGFDIVWANDFDKYACETFRANINDNIVCGDINEHLDEIPKHDILIGGFPCQPFSTLGKLKGFDDERGTLFFTIKEIITKHHPKVVVLENVKNIVNHDNGNTFRKIKEELEELGYVVYFKVHNTADFGIPQRRNRVYIVALRKGCFNDVPFEYPKPKKLKTTVQDLLDENVEEKYFISKNMIGTILGNGTKGYIVKPTIDMPLCKTLTATMHKMHRASQDNYFTDNTNYERHCKENKTNIRKLTPNECRKLQGFPSDWKQVVSDTQAYKQFGNAVTVDVAYEVAKSLISYIEENKVWEV
ncbi:MAG: DNA (cytosine-5-)-methyltransferase [Bacilli bacterium]|nr:DNA (cytosine-5-)-methyltransferase [Bacilli bacterium]MDD4734267.1 DNA (cytosine-5-)-methyltransferase [Bacilli bacterium]